METACYLPHRDTGSDTEVDVVIRHRVLGARLILSVEATDGAAKRM